MVSATVGTAESAAAPGRHREEIAPAGAVRRIRWLVVAGIWTVVALVDATQLYLMVRTTETPMTWWQALGWAAPDYAVWALITPGVLFLARRFPIGKDHPARHVAVHLGSSVVVGAGHLLAALGFAYLMDPPWAKGLTFGAYYLRGLLRFTHLEMVIYWGIVGFGHAWEYYQRYRERELRASQLETQLVQAQLRSLRMQLNPHFLFNTLHTISVLVRKKDDQAAIRMIAGLSDLLRLSLENVGAHEVTLQQEMEFLERYLAIERVRFQDRLRVESRVAPEALDALVPNLLLQPLVENAIRHGVARSASAGVVEIDVRPREGRLWMQIRDDGPGPPPVPDPLARSGVGLGTTRARLEQLYGDDHMLTLGTDPRGGAVVTLAIPFRCAPRTQGDDHGRGEDPHARRR